jgi:hypothetical protein
MSGGRLPNIAWGRHREGSMSVIRVAITVATVAVSVARHPAVRAAVRAAPLLVTPAMREKAADTALTAAYKAGAVVRRIVPRQMID